MYSWSDVRPLVPWLITTVSISYIIYIHFKLKRLKSPINPDIDKHKSKVKHVFKVENLEKEEKPKSDKTDDKSKPSRPRSRRSAYSYFVNECSHSEDNHFDNNSEERELFAEFAKKCAHNWKKLSPEEKEHFHELSKTDKIRYENEMKIYRHLKRRKSDKRKSIPENNSNTNQLLNNDLSEETSLNSAFDFFAKQEMIIIRQLMPNINNEEMLNELLKRWNSSGEEVRQKFKDLVSLESENNGKVVDLKDEEEEEDIISIGDNNESDVCDAEEEADDEREDDCNHSKSSKV